MRFDFVCRNAKNFLRLLRRDPMGAWLCCGDPIGWTWPNVVRYVNDRGLADIVPPATGGLW